MKDYKNIIKSLTISEKQELMQFLLFELTSADFDKMNEEIKTDTKIVCPHCKCTSVYGHGTFKGRSRYKCNSCKKTFTGFTGTAISGIKKVDEFQRYIKLVIESVTIKKASETLHINVKTALDWRHKLLSALENINGEVFTGIVECDDKLFDVNEKGSRKLKRKPFKRPSDRKTKRGISDDKISVMVVSDRNSNKAMQVAKKGRIDVKSIENSIGKFVTTEHELCSDAHPSIIS